MDRNSFYNNLRAYNANSLNTNHVNTQSTNKSELYDYLMHINPGTKSPMYGLQQDEVKYYKREGEPGNYRYYWTKEEYDAHLAELERQRNNNMQAAQNAEADRWKRQQQNTTKQTNINKNQGNNPEANRYKQMNEQQKIAEAQQKGRTALNQVKSTTNIAKNQGNNPEADRWKHQQQNNNMQTNINKNQGNNPEANRYNKNIQTTNQNINKNRGNNPEADRWKRNAEQQKIAEAQAKGKAALNNTKSTSNINKNQGNNPEADRWKRNAEQQKIAEAQAKGKAVLSKAQTISNKDDNINKNQGNNPEADRWNRLQRNKALEESKGQNVSGREAAERQSQKYNKEVNEINDATKRLQEAQYQSDSEYNKSKQERQEKLKATKEDLMDMSNYYRKKNGNDDFDEAFERAKKSAGSENLYFNDGDIKYYDKDSQDKITKLKQEAFDLKQENANLGYMNVSGNVDARTKASNENKYQSNYNEIKRLEREIEIIENDMKERAYQEYEQVLDQMFSAKESGQSLQTARERKALEDEEWVNEQQGSWFDQVKKKAKKIFS